MKRKLALLLVLAMLIASFASCGGETKPADDGKTTETPGEGTETTENEGEEPAEALTTASTVLNLASSYQNAGMDYVLTAREADHIFNADLVDGLLENDVHGKLVPCLAESWEHNDDSTVWTFHIRKGVKWVTNDGEEYAEVTANDFVTGLRHGADFGSDTAWLIKDIIKGYNDYMNGDHSDASFENVGVKAIDDYTLEYTMNSPVPYFDSMTVYSVLYPINRDFLESKGEGCKLGQANSERTDCKFGSLELDSILYNGGYIMTENTQKSKIVLTKNQDYWDADRVYIETVNWIYDDGSDPKSVINGFEAGTYTAAALNPSWADYDKYVEKYKDNLTYTLPNNSVFGVMFNFNRRLNPEGNLTNYVKSQADIDKTHKAIMNENFRKALRAAYDAKAAMSTQRPENLAEQMLRNIDNFPGAGTLSDGTPYFDSVTKAYNEMTGETRDLSDGQAPFLSRDEALAYIEAAKKEGVEFPVHLDMLVPETYDNLVKQGQSMKKSVEDNTDGQIIIELVMKDLDTVENIAYLNDDPAKTDYDISTFSGWSPDFMDPKSFVDTMSPVSGYYMVSFGLGLTDDQGEVIDKEIKEAIGMMEYEKLYREADAITDDLDARYKKFAEADATIIKHCFFIPCQQAARSQRVTKYVPFSMIYADAGISADKHKLLRTQEDMVLTADYDKAYEEWLSKR